MTQTLDRTADKSLSQTVRAQLELRELILSGELSPGERISELSTVDRLGVSRTPVRMALVRLEEEGLLEAIPSGGFAVKLFTEKDIFDAIEVRGCMEGLAARLAAERGLASGDLAPIKACLAELDELIGAGPAGEESFAAYVALNGRFHEHLKGLAGSPTVERQIDRANALPFASPNGFVMVQALLPEARTILTVAQDQHRSVVEAIEKRQGARAEALMREHARLAGRNLQLALVNHGTLDRLPGASLIRRRGR